MSKLLLIISAILSVVTFFGQTVAEPLSWAENVCNESLPVKKDIMVEQPVEYVIKYDGMCGILPCTKSRVETRVDQQLKTIIAFENKPSCCSGYTETPDRKCVPICLRSCNNGGRCVAPNQCRCSVAPSDSAPGYAGPTCARFTCLNELRWGSKCDKECQCPMNAYCSANSGKCLCYPGFRGANCSLECEPNSTEPECDEVNELPPILEPDANLVMDNSVLSRQRSEALILERTPDETLQQQDDRRSFGATYLAAVLACVSCGSILGFLIVKRRYDRLRTEMCYASGSSNSGSSSPSNYSASQSPYYMEHQQQLPTPPVDGMLSKNLTFAEATRQILLGSGSPSKTTTAQQTHDFLSRNKLIVNPLVESRLVRSHKTAEQNIYSEAKVDFSDRPLPTPNQQADNHVYQVPRSLASDASSLYSVPIGHSTPDVSADKDEIYEEIKPISKQR